jgi:tripartite motif-containing protein 71
MPAVVRSQHWTLGVMVAISTVLAALWGGPASAQTQDPGAPAGLACPGLVPPGSPPDDSPGWVLQWDLQWQTFNQGNATTWPVGVALDRTCNVYVADGKLNQIFKYSPNGDLLAQWGAPGKQAGQFDRLEGVAVDGAGNVYAADSGNDRLQKFSPAGQVVMVWANQFACQDVTVKCQVLPDAFFGTLNVAADNAGNVYVVDAYNEVQKFGPDGARLGRWGSEGSGPGQFRQPRGVSLDRQGNIYVADTLANRLQKLAADGKPLAQWNASGNGGPIPLNQARGVAVDGDGNLFISDTDNQRLVKLGPDGGFVGQFTRCADDTDPCSNTGGGDDPGQFLFPYAAAVDGRGDVLVADTGNYRVQVFKAIPSWTRPDDSATDDSQP